MGAGEVVGPDIEFGQVFFWRFEGNAILDDFLVDCGELVPGELRPVLWQPEAQSPGQQEKLLEAVCLDAAASERAGQEADIGRGSGPVFNQAVKAFAMIENIAVDVVDRRKRVLACGKLMLASCMVWANSESLCALWSAKALRMGV